MHQKKNCWKCKKTINLSNICCTFCSTIQEPINQNPFELFSLNKTFNINLDLLEERYLSLQSIAHPDRYVRSSEKEKKFSLLHSSNINRSYKKIKNNSERLKILLEINGFKSNDEKSLNDPSLLEEIMDIQNRCMLANESEKIRIAKELKEKIKNTKELISSLFIKKDFDNVHKSGIKLSYLEKIIGDLK
jgi:molecular chaperone HscB